MRPIYMGLGLVILAVLFFLVGAAAEAPHTHVKAGPMATPKPTPTPLSFRDKVLLAGKKACFDLYAADGDDIRTVWFTQDEGAEHGFVHVQCGFDHVGEHNVKVRFPDPQHTPIPIFVPDN